MLGSRYVGVPASRPQPLWLLLLQQRNRRLGRTFL
jgi:hypothetical protein